MGVEEVKPFDEFVKKPVVRIPIDTPYYAYKSVLESGGNPFQTESGKIEFSSNYVKHNDLTKTKWRGHFDPMPVWQPSYVDAGIATAAKDGFYNWRARTYPLSLVTPVSVYRQHSSNDDNPLLREDCYRHGVWISGVDAKARGIKDGDLVRVFSETGEMTLAAYVTNRMMPGTAAVHHGAWFQGGDGKTMLNPFGMDHRGAPNILLDDEHLPNILGTLLTSGLCEVEKVADGDTEGFGAEAQRGGLRGAQGVIDMRAALAERGAER